MSLSDDIIIDLFLASIDCLTTATASRPNPPAEICARVGVEIAHDMDTINDLCCSGFGYVSLGDTWISSDSFPEQDINRQATAKCSPPSWGQSLRLGLMRCMPTTNEENSPAGAMPTCEQWSAASLQNIYDSVSLREAACCIRNWVLDYPPLLGMSVVIQRQIQTSPLGGCAERYFTIDVQLPNCECIK